jgi:hypothetical protein
MIAVVALALGVAALFVLCFVWMTEIICDAQRRIDARQD